MTKKPPQFASVWDALEDTPEGAENMRLRSTLMMALKKHITHIEMSQAEIAKLFGITQPRVSDLMRGKINLFSLDAWVNMAAAAGMRVEVRLRNAA
jgi:predicted XRE-type DNA-binding protein